MTGRVPPHDLDAEALVVSAAFQRAEWAERIAGMVDAGDLYDPGLRDIYRVVQRMWSGGQRPSARSLRSELGDAFDTHVAKLDDPHPDYMRYAAKVADCAARRRLLMATAEAIDLTYDTRRDFEEARSALEEGLTSILPPRAVQPGPDVDEFLSGDDSHAWVVPDLLERGDRVMVTAEEGEGKSTLLRQCAVQIAAGVVPFANTWMDPRRVLLVDCENSPGQTRRHLRPLRIAAGQSLEPANLVVKVRPEGIDLLSRTDRVWFESVIEVNRPDVVMVGPVYKLFDADPTEEQPAKRLVTILDRLRTRYQFALILEAHAPQGGPGQRPLRPYGASLWRRWPEFGYGIRRTDNGWRLESWRGAREERAGWPHDLRRGGLWPWEAG